MAISSTGVGSGLDVKNIVAQLVAIEKQPLTSLQVKATNFQTQLSLYGTVKSKVSTLEDAASVLAASTGWNTQKASSSNTSAVGVSVATGAVPTAMSVGVQQLARAQSTASIGVTANTATGATGSLSIELGSWGTGSFEGLGGAISVSIDATDTVSAMATKINAAGAGVVATVLRDGTSERLVIRSASSGVEAGFKITATEADPDVDTGIAKFGFTDAAATTGTSAGMFMSQSALNAKLTVNGVAIESASNTLTNVIPSVTLQLTQTTAANAPVEVVVENDLDVLQKNIKSFVDAYNSLNQTLTDSTKYNSATSTSAALQGDSTTVGLQNTLRALFGSSSATGSSFKYLTEAGIERQKDGSLAIVQTKLTSAMQDLPNLKKLFTEDTDNASTNGFALKVKNFAHGLLVFDGLVANKSTALQASINRNSDDQNRVTDRAARVEVQLFKQYSALDTKMATLTALSSYVTSQIAQWNKSGA